MASFDFLTCKINVADVGSSADLANMPAHADMTMSFSHEYIHFLQLITSNVGFRILTELVDFGVHAALLFANRIGPNGIVMQYHEIQPILAGLPDHEGRKHNQIRERTREFMDEIDALFLPIDHAYIGTHGPWEIDIQTITHGTFSQPMHGFVVAGSRFRPFSPGLLVENMARCIDQWIKGNMEYADHRWQSSQTEAEFYNGLRHILSRPRYQHNVFPTTLDQVAVIVCTLALVTPRPDLAVYLMLQRLEQEHFAGGLAVTVGIILRKVLLAARLLHANHYNEVLERFYRGPTGVMNRREYLGVHQQLLCIHRAANQALVQPALFADDQITWDCVRNLMAEHSVPPVIASDGEVQEIAGIPCVSNVTRLLDLVQQKLF